MQLKAAELFSGPGLIVAPHVDDEVLACGGTLAQLPERRTWHVVYATDGTSSPAPPARHRQRVLPELASKRRAEARAAMVCLGLPPANLHFLDLPDGRLRQRLPVLRHALANVIAGIRPAHVLAPFRYDRHPDHLAVNRIITEMARGGTLKARFTEYFVYTRYRLLPLGDLRRYIRPGLLRTVTTSAVAARKRAALDCFESQTTCIYPWQTRPVLTPQLLTEVSRTPELFLPYDPEWAGAAVFARTGNWIRVAHRLEPLLKKGKDRLTAWCRQGAGHG